MAKVKVLLSACLAGVNCVYDGTNKFHPVFFRMHKKGDAVLFCPEALGGMKVPHSASEISGGGGLDVIEGRGKVFSKDGKDVTVFFVEGARKTLALAVKKGIKKAIMKSKSPSCGCGRIFDGTFTKNLVPGDGVTAALLKKSGLAIVSDAEYLEKLSRKVKGTAHAAKK